MSNFASSTTGTGGGGDKKPSAKFSSLLSKAPSVPMTTVPIVKLPPSSPTPHSTSSTTTTTGHNHNSHLSGSTGGASHSPSSSSSPSSHQGNASPSPSFTSSTTGSHHHSPLMGGRPPLAKTDANDSGANKRNPLSTSTGLKSSSPSPYRASTTLAQLTSHSIPSNSDNSPPSSLFSSSSSPMHESSLLYQDNEQQQFDANTKFGNFAAALKVTPAAEQPRSGHSNCYHSVDDSMYIYGGFTNNDNAHTNDFYSFNFASKTWNSMVSTSGPSSRSYHSAVVYNNAMYIFGGDGGASGLRNDLHVYSFETQLWSELFTEGQRPSARFGHSAVVDGNCMLIFGGVSGSQLSNDVYSLNFDTKAWTLLSTSGGGPQPRAFHTATTHKGVMYVIGGQDISTNSLSDIHCLTLATNTWRPLVAEGNFTARSHHAAALLQDSIVVTGGNTTKVTQSNLEVFELDIYQKRWFRIQTTVQGHHRASHSLILKGTSFYLWGGCNDTTLDYLSFGKDDFDDINQEDDGEISRMQNIPKALWESTLMKKHPEILELREKTQLLTGIKSYGRTLAQPSFTENKQAITYQFVLQLIMEYLETHTQHHKTIKIIEEETGVLHQPTETGESRLITLLRLVKPRLRSKNVLDPELSIFKKEETFDEEVQQVDNMYRRIENEEDINVWEEGDDRNLRKNEDTKKPSVKAASLNKLIQFLTSEKDRQHDHVSFMKSFLYTHQTFTTSENLLKKLIQRYSGPVNSSLNQDPRFKQEILEPIRKRVCDVIKYWIDKCPWDFKSGPTADKLVASLNNFIDGSLTRDGSLSVKNIRRVLVQVRSNEHNQSMVYSTNPPDPKVPKNIFSPKLALSDIDDLEIARQLTLIEYKMFKSIPPPEFLVRVTPYGEFQYSMATSPNLVSFLNRSNDVARWVASVILAFESKKVRVKMIEKFLKIMESLRQTLNNFQTLYSIYQGLQNAYVQSVADLFTLRTKEVMSEYESLFSKTDSFKNYRDALSKCTLPCIPLVHVIQEEIAYIETQQPPLMSQLINFVKRQNLYNIISKVEAYQLHSYNLQPVHQISTFVHKLKKVSDAELSDLAKKRTTD
ncbi:hypothetical protein SAMD00019534_106980 [Acytostelium subglobosum LB1]|uniref:hypothetical protein n=1 Tax=Acytostelium subglobosum LB1 TaxID=1410327 RepID=UPI0006449D9D|nr:hypothetical protein SAMD00019534_106980 [Acytostelium subglobosum LB1]GAM27522.1 hypothetical protein SAMD00019534_106980 [Acytostelium subglobosum LB1]|eukprot:XP_012749587.1 hypothetical protein SAMD00019534_106980 [Acytostelium subglobosum LB1]